MPAAPSMRVKTCATPNCGAKMYRYVPKGTENPGIWFHEYLIRKGWVFFQPPTAEYLHHEWVCRSCAEKATATATSWLQTEKE